MGTACRAPTLQLQARAAVERTREFCACYVRKRGYEVRRDTSKLAASARRSSTEIQA